MHNYINSRLR